MVLAYYIYDLCGNLLYNGKTYNGKITFCLKNNCLYKIYAILNGKRLRNVFYVNDWNDIYVFSFKRTLIRTIIFRLRDANYSNLPIKKGEIILWQRQ